MNVLPEVAVALDGVCLRAGSRTMVSDLSLAIGRGERWAILGPNGAGKSTLLALLAGLRPAQAGRVVVAGFEPAHWGVERLAGWRALLADRWLDPFAATVLDTVLTARYRFGEGDRAGETRALAELAHLDCAELAGHDVRTLSRGERQRVALATALAQETPLLLADEPISHQDPRHQALVLRRLEHLPQRTLVATLHDVNAARRLATHALLLSGRGHWHAGPVHSALTTESLGELFGARFAEVETPAGPLYYLADAADRQHAAAPDALRTRAP